jgi:Uma2 family endonuclease
MAQMVLTNARAFTGQDYDELPDGPPYYQLIEGDLYMSPAPGAFHQDIISNIHGEVWSYLQDHPIGKVSISPYGVYLTEINAFQPDLFFVTNQRRALYSKRGFNGAPDLVVEVLSPSTASLDRGAKREIYARTGVIELWLIDPELREIHVFQLQCDPLNPMAAYKMGDVFESAMFPGLVFSCAKIFSE